MARRNTRELILLTSLRLFNELGEPNVSTNHIADEADISPGNLYYHFRSKDDIVIELFKIYLLQMQPLLELSDQEAGSAEALCLRLHLAFETMGHYRFLFRNLTDLHARIKNLRIAFLALLARQKQTLVTLLKGLKGKDILPVTETQLDQLADNMLMLMTYWIPFAQIRNVPGLQDGSVLADTVSHTLQLLIPWMAEPHASEVSALAESYRRG